MGSLLGKLPNINTKPTNSNSSLRNILFLTYFVQPMSHIGLFSLSERSLPSFLPLPKELLPIFETSLKCCLF